MKLSIKASTSSLTVQCLIDSLRDNFNKLVQKTLTMEDPRLTISQSQPMYNSDNTVDYSEEILEESSQKQPQKAKISLSKNQLKVKLLIDTRSDILPLELNILLPELNLEISCQTFPKLELAKMTFIMKILS